MRVINDSNEINRCQDILASKFRKVGELKKIKDKSNNIIIETDVYWFPKEKLWWWYPKLEHLYQLNWRMPWFPRLEYVDQKLSKYLSPRHCNAFGLAESFNVSKIPRPMCTINIPLFNDTWHMAGAFVKDRNGEVSIVHSGKIGGFRFGIGRSLFVKYFAGSQQWIGVERNHKPKCVVVVSRLNDSNLIQNLAYFVKEVRRVKKLANTKELQKHRLASNML